MLIGSRQDPRRPAGDGLRRLIKAWPDDHGALVTDSRRGQRPPDAALLEAAGRRPAGAGAWRGSLRLRHPRPTATSTRCRACSAPSSATPTARRWPRRPRSSCARCRSTPTGRPPTRPRSSWPRRSSASRRPTTTACSSPAAAPSRSSRRGSSSASTSSRSASRSARKAIARKVAYHGVTLGALSFTGVPGFKDGFGTPPIEVTHVSQHQPLPRPTATTRPPSARGCWPRSSRPSSPPVPDEVALIIAEPIQNAGGCLTPPPGYWQGSASSPTVRRAAHGRRGDHRFRPDRRVVRESRARAWHRT